MIIIACLDDANGMMFNNRRQSKDRILRDHILREVGTSNLWMNEYTKKQFDDGNGSNLMVDNQFLEKAVEGDFCFIENVDIMPYAEKIEKVMLFKWNRSYPGDFFFPMEFLSSHFVMTSTEDFAGYSHEKITKEVYERGKETTKY